MKTRIINVNSLEILKTNKYNPTELGLVSDNAYLSIVTTNKCQYKCPYCINSKTDQSLSLPIDKSVSNIKRLVDKYRVKEAIMLGGEPLLHPDLLTLIKDLRTKTGLEFLRLTTNGKKLAENKEDFIKKLIDPDFGIQGLNISFHNEDFISLEDLRWIYDTVKKYNPDIKIRVNTNIWRGNCDTLSKLFCHLQDINFVDEVRISNIIPKDEFSVNPINDDESSSLILSDNEYIDLFNNLIEYYQSSHTIFENPETLGFVRYILIPTKCPIIINWNIGSTVSDQVCENNIETRKINTFKCLVTGDISLSWNTDNTILI